MTAVQEPSTAVRTITVTIDGTETTVADGTTIYDAAKQVGVDIPVLCHNERYDPVGVCRMCVVDTGGRAFAAACVRPCEDGMQVQTATPDVERSRAVLTEMLMSDQPAPEEDRKHTTTRDNLLFDLAEGYGVGQDTLPRGSGRGTDLSNPVIAVDHDACILCDRCVRACDDVQGNDVIGRSGKGYSTRIAFDLNDPMGKSSCVTCGECVQACPTGALTNKPIGGIPIRPREELDQVESVCPYCGVGCALTYNVDRERGAIVFAEGRDQPGSQSRLCVKGRYGWDYAASPQRLTVPLIRKDSSYPKGALSADVRGDGNGYNDRGRAGAGGDRSGGGMRPDGRPGKDRGRKPGGLVDYDEVLPHFREATWEEALDLVARRLKEIHAEGGPGAIAGFGSAKCSNEEAYLFQKLIRTGFGTNNVDHCTRLCHASSVAALFEGVGSGAVSTTYGDVINADVVIITGSNPTANHPVASSFFKQARRRGTKIIYVDPRASTVAEHADVFVQLKPGTDVAFYNALMHEVIRNGNIDRDFIANRTSNYDALARTVAEYPPERAAQITGVDADTIREVARLWGEARAGVVYWGMGISQHTTGTDNARCLIALCSITGNVGRPGTGLHPLRGQNNVQGASDAGLIPMFYPDYQGVDREATRLRFEQAWGTQLDPNRGLTVTEIVKSALEPGGVRGMYMLGENPFLSDPNINKVRKALTALDFLVVQDIFLTETAEFADVILPATSYLEKDGTYTNTDRRVQLGRKVLDAPGQARPDWEIVQDIARRVGLDWQYESPSDVFDEMVELMPSYANLRWDNLGASGKLYPNADPEHTDGTVVMFDERFNTEDGLAHLVPAEWLPAKELPDAEYPMVLNTGRLLEHWHTGSMTRRSFALDAISPVAEVYMHPKDAADRGLVHGERARVRSRRGSIELLVRVSHREQLGNVFIPFHFREAAANLLTIDEIDPFGKIPEFKFCAVQVEAL
ncbi:NAD-dependent formate dehydrogenase catalytic subunit /NAD-dependent formate dehydrogenase iron-sulfur protein [Pseudonocardia hierapolitana]|uniref:NAD-dependent formate dehydrogenase catalytic subunit /NAD-dependent formate dehydrogenase iron-sulfur protein n=1 Tax=Pseudonocardia hierapolitana TaxID=1128676 RepID=A0A561SW71_9PSEU|nr:formate dehydrogenase subunit alpha [Pseudonocardia hierapolitana]TWF79081.1 NAD-dependent formate dehydrogenase catalytic subunit /NAD-dependent formate dehydrogenase iron-sulfur protein [Pseudonocardia hierapolitana]